MLRRTGQSNISLGSDAVLALGVAGAVALLVFPLPTLLIDGLLAVQLGFSVVILLVALAVRHPLELSAFPALLLLTTLFRLALNISTTRLILSQGDAGQVVAAFGDTVVGGNFLVGAVVFAVLTLVQYLVIAKGAERVAQVGARFALDGLPGRQLAIDADVRAGLIDPETARQRRNKLARESGLFGALDGAMKFVRGDAIAGLCIVGVNVVGGLVVGVVQQGMPVGDAVQLYTVLTVGDGLVAQLPALLTSTAAAMVVTRVAAPDARHIGRDLVDQLTARPAPLWVGAGLMALLAALPGLPALPLGFMAVVLLLLARRARPEVPQRAETRSPPVQRATVITHPERAPHAAVATAREHLLDQHGLEVSPDLKTDPTLPPQGYRIMIREAVVARGEADDDALPARLLSAWRQHADALLPIQTVADRLTRVEAESPALVRAVVPRKLDLPRLTRLLRALVRESVPCRDLEAVLEALAQADTTEEPALLAHLRRHLAPQLSHQVAPQGEVTTFYPDQTLEAALRDPVGLDPDLAEDAMARLKSARAQHPDAVLMVAPDIRAAARAWVAEELPDLYVVTAEELLPETRTRMAALIGA